MKKVKINLEGQQGRKELAKKIGDIIGVAPIYAGAGGSVIEGERFRFSYAIMNIIIAQDCTIVWDERTDSDTTNKVFDGLAAAGYSFERPAPEKAEAEPEQPSELAIEIPLGGFTPESIDNLCKMVTAKETLIKKALGAEALPIQLLADRIRFPWLKPETDSAYIKACGQLITCLAETAKKKKRVTAKAQEAFENEKFALRVWLIGLGMIGAAYGETRKLLMKNLGGNSSWRYGVPERDTAPETGSGAPAGGYRAAMYCRIANDETSADTDEKHSCNE